MGRLDIHITKGEIGRIIAVEKQCYQNPPAQAKDQPSLQPNRRGNHGLHAENILLLDRLCADRVDTEEPELIVEGEIQEPQDEQLLTVPLQQLLKQQK